MPNISDLVIYKMLLVCEFNKLEIQQYILNANSTNLNSSIILNVNSIYLNSSINSQLNWNNYEGDHPNRVDLLIQNSRLDTHVEDSHQLTMYNIV